MIRDNFPLVSIVITSYNRANYIGMAVHSALEQDYENLEIIISDNCSTDDTVSVLAGYLSDPRVKLHQNEENIGMWANFNKVYFELAKGDYLIHVSSDDYLTYPGFITDAVRLIKKYKDISIVWGINTSINVVNGKKHNFAMPNKNNLDFRPGIEAFLDYQYKSYWFGAGACLINMEQARQINKVYDIDLNLELLLMGNAGFINRPSYSYRIHNANATNGYSKQDFLRELEMYAAKAAKAIELFPDRAHVIAQWQHHVISKTILSILKMLALRKPEVYKEVFTALQDQYPGHTNEVKFSLNLIARRAFSAIRGGFKSKKN